MGFRTIVITSPTPVPEEAARIGELFSAGLDLLHIRKPGAGPEDITRLLGQIPARWRSRVVLHGSREAAAGLGITRVHCPPAEWRAARRTQDAQPVFSVSLHRWEEVFDLGAGLEYAFLSPLFDSISKPGYRARKDLLNRPEGRIPCPVIGLGGIDKDTVRIAMQHGWDGVALLGWIWEDPALAVYRFEEIQKITQ